MIVLVKLEHTFELLLGSCFSLSKNSLFEFDKCIRATQAVVNTLYSWGVDIDTKFP